MMRVVLAIVAGLLLVFCIPLLSYLSDRWKLTKIARNRNSDEALEEMIVQLSDLPRGVITREYRMLQRLVPMPGFPIRPDDHLLDDLLIDQGNLESWLEDREKGIRDVSPSELRAAGFLRRLLATQINGG